MNAKIMQTELYQRLDATLNTLKNSKDSDWWRFLHIILPSYGWKIRDLKNVFALKNYINECASESPQTIPPPTPNRPIDVSIIIPVFNQWEYTKNCINSILKSNTKGINYELILADDSSTDSTLQAASYFPGIKIVKTRQNLGFLRNCNNAAKTASGRYILLLNNDTIVLQNWLAPLYKTLETNSQCVIAGSKMLFPNGKIQEAGAMFMENGTIKHIGKGFHRHTSIFNIQRTTDYVSGCSVLIRKSFWDHVGGFDERYQQAYYEDSDLALTAWSYGYVVIYQPASEIVHFWRKSYTREKQDHNYLKQTNMAIFLNKWADYLPQFTK